MCDICGYGGHEHGPDHDDHGHKVVEVHRGLLKANGRQAAANRPQLERLERQGRQPHLRARLGQDHLLEKTVETERNADLFLISKTDLLPSFDFSVDEAHRLKPGLAVRPCRGRTGENASPGSTLFIA